MVANLMILEASGDSYIYRLAGSEVVRQAGMEMTGRRIGYSKLHDKAMPTWIDALNVVRTTLTPRLFISHFTEMTVAKNVVLVLPLFPAPGEAEKLLIGSFYKGHFEPGMKISGVTITEVEIEPD